MGAAASKYRVTNSAISQGIRALETELGVSLLVHRKRFFELTDAGRFLFEKCPAIIATLDELPLDLQAVISEPSGVVRFAVSRSLMSAKLNAAILKVKKKYKKLRIEIRTGAAAEVKALVKSGDVQFAFLVDDQDLSDLSSKSIFKGEFLLFSKSKSTLTQNSGIVVSQKSKVEVVHLLRQLKKRLGRDPEVELEIMSWTAIRSLVLGSNLIGYVPDYVIQADIEKGKLHLVDGGIRNFSFEAKVIWPMHRNLPTGAKLLLEEVGG